MRQRLNLPSRSLRYISALMLFLFAIILTHPTPTHASLAGFSAGNIMDDVTMTNKGSMSESQIQSFLKSKNSCNDTNLSRLTSYNATDGWITSGSKSFHYHLSNGHFVCMADESFSGESAAHIIWQAAQDYTINPKVLIVLLQKEQGLVTDTWPNTDHQYAAATGYNCPDNGSGCNSANAGFKNQIRLAASLFHEVQTGGWSNYPVGVNYVQYNPNPGCGGTNVNIQNYATSSLYRYTPYQPNASALSAGYGSGDSCGAYGNRNFYNYFTDWFGTTHGTIYRGVDLDPVFDATYYLNRYPDVRNVVGSSADAAFQHFSQYGIGEGRQASSDFGVTTYKNRYPDLRLIFGANNFEYIVHYIYSGRFEGRTGSGTATLVPITSLNGVNYSTVYDYNTYKANYSDINRVFGNDDAGAIKHFVNSGISEGRSAKSDFSVTSYRNRYFDLRNAFGSNLNLYVRHYINTGRSEGRTATGTYYGGISSYSGLNYTPVYNFDYYRSRYSDIRQVFNLDDAGALRHFINSGMSEARNGNASFNVITYKNRYADLRAAFGNDLKSYYLHYLNHGIAEGRSGT